MVHTSLQGVYDVLEYINLRGPQKYSLVYTTHIHNICIYVFWGRWGFK